MVKFRNIVLNKYKLKLLGFKRFSVSGPQLWNNLSKSLKGLALILFFYLWIPTCSMNFYFCHKNNAVSFIFKKNIRWLDVITSRKSVKINNIDRCISDHKLLLCSCEMLKPPSIYWQLQIIRRNFLDTEKFISEVKLFLLSAATSLEVNSAFDLYNSTLSEILDKMISLKTVRVQNRLFDPWFDGNFCTSKCLKRSIERIYMKTKSEYNFAARLGQIKLYKRLCRHCVEVLLAKCWEKIEFETAFQVYNFFNFSKNYWKSFSIVVSNVYHQQPSVNVHIDPTNPPKKLFLFFSIFI